MSSKYLQQHGHANIIILEVPLERAIIATLPFVQLLVIIRFIFEELLNFPINHAQGVFV